MAAPMRTFNVSFPELAFVAVTRGLLGAGVGLLAGSHLRETRRTGVGLGLLAVGIATTIPIAFFLGRRSRG